MYTHFVKMRQPSREARDGLGPMRFHHASASLEDTRAFVAAMTAGWEPECQACRGTGRLEAIKGHRDAQPCGWCAHGPKPGPRFGSTELAYDPARFEVGPLDGFVIRQSGAIAGHEASAEDADAEVERLVAARLAEPSGIVASLRARRRYDDPEIEATVRSWFAIHPPDVAEDVPQDDEP